MKIAVNSILSLLDVGTGFCYWLLGRYLLEEEVKQIQNLFTTGIQCVLTVFIIDDLVYCFFVVVACSISAKARR
jgi:hypothetical protein